jgi:hypothetical protein
VIGYYYIDNTHPSSTDTGNTYGYPNKPRKSIPTAYAAGSCVEIRGGPYVGDQLTIVANGTPDKPVWIRGSSSGAKPTIRYEVIINGSYVILENLFFDTSEKTLSFRYKSSSVDHACIRNSEFAGPGTNIGNNAVIYVAGTSSVKTSNIVIYNNHVHDFGDDDSASENDYHGVLPGEYSEYVWVLSNHIHNMGGDSIQVGQATYSADQRPNYVYIGGNTFHDDRENAVDIKRANHVIVSQNTCYGYEPTGSSAGEVIIIHDGPDNVWILYNKIHSGSYGIQTTQSTNTYFIGNLVYNIHHPSGTAWDPNSGYSYGAAIHFRGASTGGAIANTLYDYDTGIQLTQGTAAGYDIKNNIFAGRAEPLGMDIRVGDSSVASGSNLDYCLFYYGGGSARIYWNASAVNVATFKSRYGKCLNCPGEADPLFGNPAGGDFHLQASSPAKDKGTTHPAYTTFFNQYGVDIRKDTEGRLRPQGAAWDIGAYEFELAPLAPKNVRVKEYSK